MQKAKLYRNILITLLGIGVAILPLATLQGTSPEPSGFSLDLALPSLKNTFSVQAWLP